MNRNHRATAFLCLVAIGVLAACASTATSSPTSTAASIAPTASTALPGSTPLGTLSPSPTMQIITAPPGPTVIGPVTLVTGTLMCSETGAVTTTTDASGGSHWRDGRFDCTERTDDSRVNGASTYAINADTWESSSGAGALVQWGAARITNAKGAWTGTYTGVANRATGDTIAAWYVGSGEYAGLSYFELITGIGPWDIKGQVFPGDPPRP